MAGYSTAGLNAASDGIAAAGTWIQMHTADPGAAGTTGVTGSRAQTTWGAASNGSRTGTQVSIAIGAGVTVTHWSLWSASSAGTFLGGFALSASEAFGAAGTIQHTPTITSTN